MSTLHTWDWIVIAGYFFILLGLAWWVIRQRQDTSTDYFLAGRHLGWFIIGVLLLVLFIGGMAYYGGYNEKEMEYENELKEIEKQKFINDFVQKDYETAKQEYIKILMAGSLTIPRFLIWLFIFGIFWRLLR